MWIPMLVLMQSGCIAVSGDRILAGDLAPYTAAFSSTDPQTMIGYAPLPGLERRLTRSDLRRALGAAAGNVEIPYSLCVVRTVSRTDPEQIRNAMRTVLPEGAELELLDWSPEGLPEGLPEFALTGLKGTPEPDRYVWRGRWVPKQGGRSSPIAAIVRLRVRRPVLVSARAIEAGAALAPEDLTIEWRDVPPARWASGPPQLEVRTLTGYRTRRAIPAGQVVDTARLIPPEAARAGQAVTLISEVGAARIAVEAEALTGGRLGDVILVKSRLNGRRLRARLEGPGQAVAERSNP